MQPNAPATYSNENSIPIEDLDKHPLELQPRFPQPGAERMTQLIQTPNNCDALQDRAPYDGNSIVGLRNAFLGGNSPDHNSAGNSPFQALTPHNYARNQRAFSLFN